MFLWFLNGDTQLSIKAKKSIQDSKQTKFISIASIWEIAIKLNLKKLTLKLSLEDLKQEVVKNGFEILPLDFDHIIGLQHLKEIHKDPFDRIIIAQAISENLCIITKDKNFDHYPVKIIW